jgi:hypothetical protein
MRTEVQYLAAESRPGAQRVSAAAFIEGRLPPNLWASTSGQSSLSPAVYVEEGLPPVSCYANDEAAKEDPRQAL